MAFTKACSESDIAIGDKKRIKVGDQTVLVFHLEDGFYATAASCTHMFAPLARGKINDGCTLVCPFHRAEFDIKTGEVQQWANFPPGIAQLTNMLRKQKALATFPTKVEDGAVLVDV
ncbi:MAG: Rieske (2Fe-2S) protein [Immundisolibacteraceae bacterium]|nr:Rieske (2Fe-2S) protein [Immundisolibacteraceae bacterium]